MMASLAISYSVNVDRVTADYRDMQAAKVSAEAELQTQRATHGQERAALEDDLTNLRDELANRSERTRTLEAANSELRINLRQAEAARESITSKIAQLGVTTETQARIIDEYKTELSRLRDGELAYRDEKIDLEKAISDLESKVSVYEQVKRKHEETITELREIIAQLDGSGPLDADGSEPQIVTLRGSSVRGTIDQVLNDPNSNKTRVRVNLGSNDRLSANTRMHVIRNDTQYLGDIIIETVDLNTSVGYVEFLSNNSSPLRAGDSVRSSIGG
jgi:chromosome segregation ATPase